MLKFVTATAAATIAMAGLACAEDSAFAMQIDARQGIMDYRALQLGTLGAMAKGDAEYNAEAAQKAAANLLAATTIDVSMLWPKGSDSDSDPSSHALPAIWADGSDIGEKDKALVDAVTAMQAAAGGGLDALKAAMQPIGAACSGCHKAYRVSNN